MLTKDETTVARQHWGEGVDAAAKRRHQTDRKVRKFFRRKTDCRSSGMAPLVRFSSGIRVVAAFGVAPVS